MGRTRHNGRPLSRSIISVKLVTKGANGRVSTSLSLEARYRTLLLPD